MRARVWVGVVLVCACGGGDPGGSGAGGEVGRRVIVDRAGGDGSEQAAGGPPTPGALGDPCTPNEAAPAGTCGDGLLCMPGPGGYCLARVFGGETCPENSARAISPRAGELCLKPCDSDSACRREEGYVCDTTWNACAPPGLLAPRPPECAPPATAPAKNRTLARRTFSGSAQLTTQAGPGRYHFEAAATLAISGRIVGLHIAGTPSPEPNPLSAFGFDGEEPYLSDHVVQSARQNHFDPWIAANRRGELFAVWLGFDGGRAPERNMQIAFSQSVDGQRWTNAVDAHDPADCPQAQPGCLDKPMIAVGPDPTDANVDLIYVFYWSSPREEMRMRRSADGGRSWDPSVTIGSGAFGDVWVSSRGHVHVVFVAPVSGGPAGPPPNVMGDARNAVFHTKSEDGGRSWSSPARVSLETEPVPFFFSNPQVVAFDGEGDPRGQVFVAYPSGTPDGAWDIRLAISGDGGGSWNRTRVNDDDTCANHMTPVMALDPDGRVHLIWKENRGGAGRVAYTSCDRTGRCAPNEAVSDAPFAAYTFARHASMWMGEYDSLIVDARRRTITAIWTQPVNEGGVATSRIFYATGRLRFRSRVP